MINRYVKRYSTSLITKKCESKPPQGISSHLSEWQVSKRQEITNVGKDVEKREPFALLVEMQTGPATKEKNIEIPQKN